MSVIDQRVDGAIGSETIESSLYANQPEGNPDVRDCTDARSGCESCRELVADFDSDENTRRMIRIISDYPIKDTRPLISWDRYACRPP